MSREFKAGIAYAIYKNMYDNYITKTHSSIVVFFYYTKEHGLGRILDYNNRQNNNNNLQRNIILMIIG